MNDEVLFNQLEELANTLGIAIRHENINVENLPGTGGLCRIKGEYVLILHSRLTVREKIRVLTGALRQFDLDEIYVKPALRALLEESAD